VWTTRAKSALSALVLGAAATFGGTGTAQAALYTGSWDPAYGAFFPGLGWSAKAVFNVPAPCLAINGNYLPVSGNCAGFDVLSAQVSFYEIGHPDEILGSYNLDTDVTVTGINIAGGALTGVYTDHFDYFIPSLGLAGGGMYSFSLILYGGNLAQLIYAHPQTASPFCANEEVPGETCGKSENPAVGVFTATPVPEPETVLLMLAGLGAIGLSARRRRRV
jgi:hypothetical protein